MKPSIRSALILWVVLVFILCACNFPLFAKNNAVSTTAPVPEEVTTAPPPNQSTEAVMETEPPVQTTEPPVPVTETAKPIVHTDIPTDSTYMDNQLAVDCNTGGRLPAGSTQVVISGCDYWNREMLERPAASADGEYVPALDILRSQAGKSWPWVFFKIHFFAANDKPEGFQTGFEIDPDLDSRGEILLLANGPLTTQWTTDGVQVWQDKDGDVGGIKPFHIDENFSGDGYETNLVDSGVGEDPDLAWARISPNDSKSIEFALKVEVLSNQNVFGWWAWSGTGSLEPGKFELIDHDQDADVWNTDNSCSWVFGQAPVDGLLANQCVVIKPTPTVTNTVPANTPQPGCPLTYCRLGTYFDQASCSCKPIILRIPTNTPIIIY